jgi:uncharacterized protein YneR
MDKKIKIGIIGTAGRDEESLSLLNKNLFNSVVTFIRKFQEECNLKTENITLISGGSSWMDHIVIKLFLIYLNIDHSYEYLDLYLPCEIHDKDTVSKDCIKCVEERNYCHFKDNDKKWYINPGRSLNNLHSNFSKKMSVDTLQEIVYVSNLDKVNVNIESSMNKRNDKIAENSDLLLAFTFGDIIPPSGGSLYTWNKCKNKKLNIDLNKIENEEYRLETINKLKNLL